MKERFQYRTNFHVIVTVAYVGLLLFLIAASSCSSGSGQLPPGGTTPDELTLLYCRVVNESGEMHVQWAADRPTTGEIRYGVTSFTQVVRYSTLADTHDTVLFGLEFSTQYNYLLTVTDDESNSLTCTGSFDTPNKAIPEPIIMGLTIEDVTEHSAHVSWRTDEPATTILYYGIGATTDSVVFSNLNQQHEVELTGLVPSTVYTVRPEAVDVDNDRGFGRDTTLVTAQLLTLWFPDATVPLGDTVEIQVHIEDAEDLAALQYTIEFEQGLVEILDLNEGAFYTDHAGFAFFRVIRNSRGELSNHITWSIAFEGNTPIGTEADGGGVLATFKLRGIEPGTVSTHFAADSTFGLDMFANQRACSLRAGIITVGQQ